MKVVLQIVAIINEKSYLQQQQEVGSMNAWTTAGMNGHQTQRTTTQRLATTPAN
jgi:hypothetical protein